MSRPTIDHLASPAMTGSEQPLTLKPLRCSGMCQATDGSERCGTGWTLPRQATPMIAQLHWILYVFGAFLILTATKILFAAPEIDPANNFWVRLARRLFPVAEDSAGPQFVVRRHGRWLLTPLALALLVVESADLLFAVDSIPAIFAITLDPFLAFTSNVFAILGLRSLFFALSDIIDRFRYLKISLAFLLALIGVKMLFKNVLLAVPGLTYYTLGTIALILLAGIVASLIRPKRQRPDVVEELATTPFAQAVIRQCQMRAS